MPEIDSSEEPEPGLRPSETIKPAISGTLAEPNGRNVAITTSSRFSPIARAECVMLQRNWLVIMGALMFL